MFWFRVFWVWDSFSSVDELGFFSDFIKALIEHATEETSTNTNHWASL